MRGVHLQFLLLRFCCCFLLGCWNNRCWFNNEQAEAGGSLSVWPVPVGLIRRSLQGLVVVSYYSSLYRRVAVSETGKGEGQRVGHWWTRWYKVLGWLWLSRVVLMLEQWQQASSRNTRQGSRESGGETLCLGKMEGRTLDAGCCPEHAAMTQSSGEEAKEREVRRNERWKEQLATGLRVVTKSLQEDGVSSCPRLAEG